MTTPTQCFATTRKLRGIVTCVSFGGVFLWILFGSYNVDVPQTHDLAAADGDAWAAAPLLGEGDGRSADHVGRRLMSLSPRVIPWHKLKKSASAINASDQCFKVHKVGGNVSQCKFVRTVDSCKNGDGFINYLEFVYCTVPHKLIPLAMIILFLWLVILFIFLGATAEEYFCPALKVMSQVLRLSQNVAGVTLLALGNGAPDIFAAFAAINQADDRKASLAIGALFGAGIFVTTIVVGLVALCKPFSLTQRPFLRDIIFYTAAVYWTFYLLWTNSISLWNAAGFVGLYVFYVVVVIVGRIFFQKWWKPRELMWLNRQFTSGDIPKPPTAPKGKELSRTVLEGKGEITNPTFTPTISQPLQPDQVTVSPPQQTRSYRIMSVGSSEFSGQEQSINTIIQVEDIDKESSRDDRDSGSELESSESSTGEGGLALPSARIQTLGASVPLPIPDSQHHQLAHERARQRGASADPQINCTDFQDIEVPKMMRKTISGALDVTEEVGAAFGIPHVPQIWEEVHRSHRSHSFTRRTPIPEEEVPSHHKGKEEKKESEDEESAPLLPKEVKSKRPHPFVMLLKALWPFGEAFRELGILGKIYETIKSPVSIILTLTVPVVDNDEDLNNWNKWLNVLHCVTSPLIITFISNYGLYLIGGVFPMCVVVLIVSTLMAILVACTSTSDRPPRYHCVFAWIGFAVSVAWIYSIANEIVNLLQAFGVVIKLSDGILGLTLLAWGNSIGDAVSNVTMAKQGFPRMAVGACFGGPLLNMLLGIGIASLVKAARRKAHGFEFKLYFTQVEFLATLFLIASLASSLLAITVLRFRLRRVYGLYLVVFYVVFLIIAILAELQVFNIHIHGVLEKEL